MSQKKQWHSTLAHNFAKYWPIFKIILPADIQQWLCNEIIVKDPITP